MSHIRFQIKVLCIFQTTEEENQRFSFGSNLLVAEAPETTLHL